MDSNIYAILFVALLYTHNYVLAHDIRPVSSIHEKLAVGDLDGSKEECQGTSATCIPFIQCPAHVYQEKKTTCKIVGGNTGICCSTGRNLSVADSMKSKIRGHHSVKLDPITLGAVARHSASAIEELKQKESRMLLSAGYHTVLYPGPATYSHYRNSKLFDVSDLSEVMGVASRALKMFVATKTFKNRHGLTNKQLEFNMIRDNLRPTALGDSCLPMPLCPPIPTKYRRLDGTCNNPRYPTHGSALTPYNRLLPPNYEDGIWTPRVSVYHDQPLPSPRLISTNIIHDKDMPNEEYTLMLMQFGQFLSHDITQSIDTSYENGSAIACCTSDGRRELPEEQRHYACLPIFISEEDEFYGVFGQKCMNFVRSLLAPRQDCTLGYSQQMNKITHFIDGSSIYGSTPQQTRQLRSFRSGRLRTFNDYGRELLPLSKDPDACLTMEQGSACFTSGDTRTNQMVSLAVMHTLFMREHNRIANILQSLNPLWDDEKLFLESRQIVIAELQSITYKEFLPTLIGYEAMEEFQITLPEEEEYSHDYDEYIDPSVSNEFATAAFRFGHSMVDGILKIYGRDKMEEMISLPEVMFQPSRMRKRQFLDEVLSALTTEPIQDVDHYISDVLTRYMFRGGSPFGVDLASINLQRGRDHGLRGYNDYRKLTGQHPVTSFKEFGSEIGYKLQQVYYSVDDIDLWLGGLLEPKEPGMLLGRTFRDIIADQFARLKKGDRYFFDLHPRINPGHFTPAQMRQLRKATLSRIICDNSDGIYLAKQALNAFKKPGVPGNEFYECDGDAIPRMILMPWQEDY